MASTRKPTSVHKLTGTYRPDRHENGEEIEFEVSVPDMPSNLKGNAAKTWKRLIKDLEPLGYLTRFDADLLGLYCHLVGGFLDDANEMSASAMNQMRLIAAEFGFTPSSRAKLSLPTAKKPKSDPLDFKM